MTTLERVTECFGIGEAPFWDAANQTLYFVDVTGRKIVKYIPETKKLTKVSTEKYISFIIPVEGKKNQFIVPQDNDLVVISWDGENDKISTIEKLGTVDTFLDKPIVFNDAKCDSSGRLWAGAHHVAAEFAKTEPLGSLYSLDSKRQLRRHVDKIRCTNGMAFNDETRKMYYIDTLEMTIDQFDFDLNSGTISNRQPWFSVKNFNLRGVPDGMTIDTDGNLWVAMFEGSQVLKIDGGTRETLLKTIDMPTSQVTNVTFGGPHLDELYVTTGCFAFEGKKPTYPFSGATYKITETGCKGLPGVNFKLNK